MSKNEEVGFASALRAGGDLIAHVAEVMHKALDAVDENWHLSCMDPDGDGSCSKGHYARRMLAEDVAPKVIETVRAQVIGEVVAFLRDHQGYMAWRRQQRPGLSYGTSDVVFAAEYVAAVLQAGDAATTAVGTAGGGQPNASDLGSVETQKGNTE